jgi:hypothetical protein
MSHPFNRCSAIALLALLFVSATAGAQDTLDARSAVPCRGTERPEQADRAFGVLTSADPDTREALASVGIATQSPSAPHGVLRATSACARLRAALRKNLRPADEPAEGLKEADLSFVELGDYYGVIVVPTTPPANGLRRAGPAPLYIFDKEKIAFVARLAL